MEGSEAADPEADLGSPLGSTPPPPSPASPRSGPYGSLQMGWVLPHATRHSWLTRLCLCALLSLPGSRLAQLGSVDNHSVCFVQLPRGLRADKRCLGQCWHLM